MKSIRIALSDYLIKPEFNDFLSIKTAFSRLYLNKNLITLRDRIITSFSDQDIKEKALLKLRHLIKQVPREPLFLDPSRFDENHIHLLEIKKEQKVYDPLKWVNAELEFIASSKDFLKGIQGKTWWSFKEVMQLFGISKSTLYLRISNGMPCYSFGGSQIFMPQEVEAWIKGEDIEGIRKATKLKK